MGKLENPRAYPNPKLPKILLILLCEVAVLRQVVVLRPRRRRPQRRSPPQLWLKIMTQKFQWCEVKIQSINFWKQIPGWQVLRSKLKEVCKPRRRAIKFKKVQTKNSWNQINQFHEKSVEYFQKLIFGHFWNCKKWNLVKKNFVIELFDFTSFFRPDFF